MSYELWLPTRGYLQRAHAPNIDFYRSEADMSMPGPVPLYRDFMRHYEESLLVADVPKQLDAPEAVEPEPHDTAPEPPVVSPSPVKKVRVFHAGGATLRGLILFRVLSIRVDSLTKFICIFQWLLISNRE